MFSCAFITLPQNPLLRKQHPGLIGLQPACLMRRIVGDQLLAARLLCQRAVHGVIRPVQHHRQPFPVQFPGIGIDVLVVLQQRDKLPVYDDVMGMPEFNQFLIIIIDQDLVGIVL